MLDSRKNEHVDSIMEKSNLLEEEASFYYFKEPTKNSRNKVDTSYITVYKE